MSARKDDGPERLTLHETYFLRIAGLSHDATRARIVRARQTMRTAACRGDIDARSYEQALVGYERLLSRGLTSGGARDMLECNKARRPSAPRDRNRVAPDVLASARVLDDRAGGYVSVQLTRTGAVTCTRPDLLQLAGEIHDAVCAGRSHDARGAAELAALIAAIPHLWDHRWACLRTADLGAWRDLYIRYETHRVFEAAVRRHADASHDSRRDRALEALGAARYGRPRGATRRETLIGLDLPVAAVVGATVGLYRDEMWEVPLTPHWHGAVYGTGIAIVSGLFICGRDPTTPDTLYALVHDRRSGFVGAARHYDARTGELSLPVGGAR